MKPKRVAQGPKVKGKAAQRSERQASSSAGKPELITRIAAAVGANREAIHYVVLFLVLCFVFYLFYYSLTVRGSLVPLKSFTASMLGSLFSLVGKTVTVKGAIVSINGFGIEIIDECTAVFSSIVYCACILAYPTTLKNKGIGLAFGIPLLFAINILRLAVLTLVGLSAPHLFEFVHVYLWQASFIIFVVILFLIWLKLVERSRPESSI